MHDKNAVNIEYLDDVVLAANETASSKIKHLSLRIPRKNHEHTENVGSAKYHGTKL